MNRVLAIGMILVPLVVPARASAQEAGAEGLRLTLEDAVQRAIDHNPDLAVVRLGTDVEAARISESRAAFAPVFSMSAGRSSTATPSSNLFSGSAGVNVHDLFSTTGVRQRLAWGGGTWSVSWDAARTSTDNPISSFDPSVQSGIQIAFSQPLLKDRRMDAARHQYIVAQRNQTASDLRFRESVAQTVAAVKQAYWTLKASRANVTVQEQSLALARELARQNQIRVDAGQIPPLDLVQAQAEVAQRQDNLIRASTAADDAEDALRRLIIDPADEQFWRARIEPIDEPADRDAPPDVEAAVAAALAGRNDIARASLDLETARTDVAFLDGQRLPDVRLETSYRGSGLGGNELLRTGGFPGTITGIQRSGFGDALGQAFGADYPTWSVGVTVSYPIGRSYEEASLARAEVQTRQAAHRLASLRLQAEATVRQAARQVRSTAERIEAARAGARLAEERLDTEQRRYEAGLSTTFLVTQAQRDLVQAQVNLLQTTLDHEASLVTFEAVQQAPPLAQGETIAVRGGDVVLLPPGAPQGAFRSGAGAGF